MPRAALRGGVKRALRPAAASVGRLGVSRRASRLLPPSLPRAPPLSHHPPRRPAPQVTQVSGSGAAPPRRAAMHGRLKLRPSEAQAAARRREREEKLRLYRTAMAAIFEKRRRGQLDGEALALAAAVLAAQPDVGTLWNVRREALARPPAPGWAAAELALAGGCLGVNPKSYGAWHHRAWVLRRVTTTGDAAGDATAEAEGALCARLLAADPRNFHAWEHRRAVAGADGAGAELEFAASLLARDFSNFSAWHYRGELLRGARTPGPPGGGGGPGALGGGRLRQELELVHNAVFTDPNDQSAWVYLRCLLSRARPPAAIICLYVNREDATLAATFSRPVAVSQGSPELELTMDEAPVDASWRSAEGRRRPGYVWLCDLPPDALDPPLSRRRFRVTWRPGPAHRDVILEPGSDESWSQEPVTPQELFWPEMGGADPAVMQEQVETCRELLELEPRSRGPLLTLVLLLSCLDPAANEAETLRCLQTLLEADPLRGGFVRDLRSRAAAAAGILRLEGAGEAPPPDGPRLCLAGRELTSLPLLERLGLVTGLELGGNRLRGPPAGLGGLRRLRVLDLSHNEVATLAGLPPLPRLEELLLDGNPISHAPALAPLAACPRLARLGLAGTPLAAAPGAAAHLAELLPRVEVALA
ncbi:LOW QUALITY PROTEIN: geranylgeranyl transferase type-2 subunit alpha [Apteryx mantelli]|uniref:Geranylgeranyl transferase type-2 subunit alpha n=1 Tax=Apteryx mantelli TaxID=2696672 RepID=A0ABM4G1K8_9AVES